MSNLQNNAKAKQPAPLPPPQQQHHPQQYQYPQHTQYPYTNPYYYSYYNTYPQTQPPPPPSHTNLPPPPPPNAYYNPYFPNPLPLQPPPQTWLRNPNNPPPPPPKPLISPNHTNNTNAQNSNNKNSNISNGNNAIHPPALQLYIEKCWNRFKSLPPHLSTSQEQHKLQKQLKGRVQETKSNKTLFTIDWKNEQYPPHLRHLIEIATKANSNSNSNSISHKKRKSQSGWIESKTSRKVAKISMSHRAVHQMDKKTKKFLQSPIISNNKCDSDMSCSDHESETNHTDHHHHHSINFQIQRNDKVNNKLKFKNPFNIDDESTDESEEQEAYVFTKGRGFSTQKIKKRIKKSHKKKKKNKKHKKKSFSWNSMDGIDALNTDNNKNSHNHNDDDDVEMSEISRILERKKRFESKQQENKNKNKHKKSKKHTSNISVGALSRDMQQLMEWHNKRVQGTCTKVEKDYFRLTCEPNPSEVRTLDTMQKAFSLLMIRWKTKNKKRDYLYVGGQFKSLRQDLRVQHIRNGFSVGVYEENARICLEVGDLSEYNQCQGQLKELYAEMEAFANNYIEFLSYRLLYEAVTKNFDAVSRITKIEKQHCRNKEIVNTLKIIDAIQRTDYYHFFKIYNVLRYHGQCIINQIIYKIRYQTLCRIAVSYCPSTYPIKKLIKTIGFKNEKECIQYLRNTGCVLQRMEKKLVLNCKASRGKIKEFIPKSEDDELGVTHGSVYHSKNQDETISIVNFLRKT